MARVIDTRGTMLQEWAGGLVPWLNAYWCPNAAWLAGYPRSGAARVRTLLAACFNHRTASIYTEQGLGEDYNARLKTIHGDANITDLVPTAMAQGALFFKTHQRITAPAVLPAIVIVRDARRVFSSLRAFFRQNQQLEYSAEDVIAGRVPWGDWSEWVRAWQMYGPRNALWLRYEDLMRRPVQGVNRIAAHFGLEVDNYDVPDFAELHNTTPTIFRAAEMEGNGGLTPAQEEFFWQQHGATMNSLGYYREE